MADDVSDGIKVMRGANNVVGKILGEFGVPPNTYNVQFLGNHGGYSGSRIWRVSIDVRGSALVPKPSTDSADVTSSHEVASTCRTFFLRQYPEFVAPKIHEDQAARIQQVLHLAVANGFPARLLPLAIAGPDGKMWRRAETRVFELNAWLPGKADFWDRPTDKRLVSIMRWIAEFHSAISEHESKVGVATGLIRRKQGIESWTQEKRYSVQQKLALDERLAIVGQRILDGFAKHSNLVHRRLESLLVQPTPIQFCIRDLWHDHVLFDGDEVSGLVDFGAMAIDSVASDLSRLLGSLLGNDWDRWQIALDEYSRLRPLTRHDRELIVVYDRSTTMLAGMNWLKWILLENRTFEPFHPIINRMNRLADRMTDWDHGMDHGGLHLDQ